MGGYLLGFSVIAFLPSVAFALALLNQQCSYPAFAACVVCLALWRAMDLWRAQIMTRTEQVKKATKDFHKATAYQLLMLLFAVLWLVVFGIRMYFKAMGGDSFSMNLSMFSIGVNVRELLDPVAIGVMVFKFLMIRIMTILVTTEIILQALFDTTDDAIRVKEEGE